MNARPAFGFRRGSSGRRLITPRFYEVLNSVAEALCSYAKVFLACILIATVSLGILVVQYAFPDPTCIEGYPLPATICYLGNSPSTPWGVVTSMFVHSSFWEHYLPNIILLFFFASAFVSTNTLLPAMVKRQRQFAFLIVMFASAVAANIVSLLVQPAGLSRGASGLVYAAWGVATAFCTFNVLPKAFRRQDFAQYYFEKSHLLWVIWNLCISVLFVGTAAIAPAAFLGVGPGVNVIAHGLSYLFAFGGTVAWIFALEFTQERPSSPISEEERKPRPREAEP